MMDVLRPIDGNEFQNARNSFLSAVSAMAIARNAGPVTQSFFKAAFLGYMTLPNFRSSIDEFLASEKVENTSYQVNKVYKAWQSTLLPKSEREFWEYPANFRGDEDLCYEHLDYIFASPNSPGAQLFQKNVQGPLQVNRGKERAKIMALGLAFPLEQPKSREAMNVHEYGSAAGMVLKALAMRRIAEVKIVNADGSMNNENTAIFNGLTYIPPRFKEAIGVEMQPPKTDEDKQRIKAQTLDPESLDGNDPLGTQEKEFDEIMNFEPPQGIQRITLIEGDLLDLPEDAKQELSQKKAHVGFASHIFPENIGRLDELKEVIDTYTTDNATKLHTEYAYVDPDNPYEVVLLDRWYSDEFSCVTFVDVPGTGFVPIIQWKTAQCRVGKLCPGIQYLTNTFDI